jgi:rod shape-determining protein MreD
MSERLPGIRPRAGVWRRLDMSARRGFPSAIAALLMVLAGAPLGFAGQAQVQIAIALASVFFWSLFRPASMPPWMVFLLGILLDLLGFAPLGVGVLLLLSVHGFALRWRRTLVRLGFVPVWVAFTMLAVGTAFAQWALTSALALRFMPVGPALFLAALATGMYPLLAVPLTLAHRSLADPELA